jgi:hypothetical protein
MQRSARKKVLIAPSDGVLEKLKMGSIRPREMVAQKPIILILNCQQNCQQMAMKEYARVVTEFA